MKRPSETPLVSHEPEKISGSTIAKISALLLAAGIGIGVVAYGTNVGFNNDPRAPHSKGIELTNQKANKKVMCLRELFHDLIKRPFFRNKWRDENCNTTKMRRLSTPPNQLRNIVEERKSILQKQGIDPATETWLRDIGNMRIKIDKISRERGINAGKIKK